ncbi:MAG: pentapeptide repeat-containing protein [Cyanobacteria bacterium P01_C01_bin.69]
MFYKRVLISLCLICFSWLSFSPFAVAAPLSLYLSNQPTLTLTTLKQRIASPIRQSGASVIDLKGFTIDLSPSEDSSSKDFSEQFYQQLQKALTSKKQIAKNQKTSRPLGLDFSGALIKGDFQLARLTQRVPAYGDALIPELETFKQSFQPTAARQSFSSYPSLSANRLSRFLLPPMRVERSDTLVLQGPLLMNQTCFTGRFSADGIYFLNRIESQGTIFTQQAEWPSTKFAQTALFSASQFQQGSNFRSALFAALTRFNQAQFNGPSDWKGANFYGSARFAQADFQTINFARAHWHTDAGFEQAKFRETATFQKSRFDGALYLTDAVLEGAVNFRQAQFQESISLRAAHILTQLDLGDARFAQKKKQPINVADLDFSSGEARILGSPGYIGKLFSVPTLTGNETVLRNLVRNFRLLEQIGDANQLEFTLERLRLAQVKRHLLGTSLNQTKPQKLVDLGFSLAQATAIVNRVAEKPFVSRADLLGMDEVDLATYLKVRDRITTQSTNFINRCQNLLRWLVLAGLLQLSSYGTNVGLIFSVGVMIVVLFALMFWGVDRYRRLTPTPIVPTREESIAMAVSSLGFLAIAFSLLVQSASQPLATLAVVGLLTLPIPGVLIAKLYQAGRYHDLMDRSYFVENGALRKLQVLITRLPVLPKFPFFRERYTPILSDRRWNWLNYFDLSLNNWFKFGFNDIRLRDRCVPGLVSVLVWYQWSLGVIYITLLLWTLSRTIPGLNLLLYF